MNDSYSEGFPTPDMFIASRSSEGKLSPSFVRKIVCRYGRGCTHKLDPTHRERFWHPEIPELTGEQIRTQYICYECGESFINLLDLQVQFI